MYGKGTTTNKQYKKGQKKKKTRITGEKKIKNIKKIKKKKKTRTTGQKEDAYSVADHI